MTTKKITRELPVTLNKAQQAERAEQMAALIGEQSSIETALAEYGAKKRGKLKEVKKEIRRLAAAVTDGTELVEVACRAEADFSTNTMTIIRLDTKKVVEQRKLTNDERQMDLTEILEGATKKRAGGKGAANDDEPDDDEDDAGDDSEVH